jgi:enoyl-CoA hydratase
LTDTTDHLKVQQDGRLLRVTLNRPDGNGVSDRMAARLAELVLQADATSDAVLLSSVGPDFCTGRVRDPDMPKPASEAYERRPEYDAIFGSYQALRGAKIPVISVVRGRAMGFGAAIVALSDVSFAAESATFNIPEITHNVMPTMVMSALYDRLNRNAILWMAYSADFISAERALNYGLVSQTVADDQLDAEVERFCSTLLSRPRPAILGLKEYLRVAPRMDEQGAIDYGRSLHSMVNTASAMKKKAG